MSNLFVKKLEIKNFKCFEELSVNFCVPNGNPGSGLNLIIGENGHGKTTLLEAINFLTCGRYVAENRININDFFKQDQSISIRAAMDGFQCRSTIDFYKDWVFKSNGIVFEATPRTTKQRGKLLSSPFEIKSDFIITEDTYFVGNGSKNKPIDSRDKNFSAGQINDDGLNIFYFDKNRARHLHEGTFKTTFNKICEDLNYKFLKKINEDTAKRDEITKNISGEYFKNVLETVQKGAGSKIGAELAKFFENDLYKDLKIDLINTLHPFSDAFFAIRADNDLSQILVKDLGSGIEIILALLLLRSIAAADLTPSQKSHAMIYLIDEPELHLHPKALEKLGTLMLEESKTKQVFLTTHSPYLYKSLYSEGNIYRTVRKSDGKNSIESMPDGKGWFPWSPSWGEINYRAFGMLTVELHNELYGYVQEQFGKERIDDLDDYLLSKNIPKNKKWTRNGSTKDVTLSTYIRHTIHHPENRSNGNYTQEELEESVKKLIVILES